MKAMVSVVSPPFVKNKTCAKEVEAFDRWSYQSILGAEIAIPTYGLSFDLDTELRGYWLHEFNDDDEIVNYTLIDSTQTGKFMMRAPESDAVQLGIGAVAKFDNGLQLRADVDGQWSKNYYSAVFSGALLYEF